MRQILASILCFVLWLTMTVDAVAAGLAIGPAGVADCAAGSGRAD